MNDLAPRGLMSKLPFAVDKDDLDLQKGFDHAFWTGLSPQGAVKGMQCGHSFVVRAATETSGCKGKTVQMKQQALAIAKSKADPKAAERTQLDTLSGEYSSFNQRVVSGIEMMVDRLENGDFPPVMHNVANKCQDMCPSMERITKEWRPSARPAASRGEGGMQEEEKAALAETAARHHVSQLSRAEASGHSDAPQRGQVSSGDSD
ncbi:unnamed protein product [Prorocentrum cordatum]|uniref:Uncharacterized protein n=1 Tax=Prorocentrum cordatum TaxID=2364126 RepID=A0ABN9R041_9DINO|nr:unnamed protein product [Polarella glacialis]